MAAAQSAPPEASVPSGIDDPLTFMRIEHDRQLGVCDRLEALTDDISAPAAIRDAAGILAHLTGELPLHKADEEDTLFVLLRGRCPPSTGIDQVVERLRSEHRRTDNLIARVSADLRALVAGRPLVTPLNFIVAAFALIESQRHHIAQENDVLLPLARRYLTHADCSDMAEAIRSRRRQDG